MFSRCSSTRATELRVVVLGTRIAVLSSLVDKWAAGGPIAVRLWDTDEGVTSLTILRGNERRVCRLDVFSLSFTLDEERALGYLLSADVVVIVVDDRLPDSERRLVATRWIPLLRQCTDERAAWFLYYMNNGTDGDLGRILLEGLPRLRQACLLGRGLARCFGEDESISFSQFTRQLFRAAKASRLARNGGRPERKCCALM